MKRPPLTPLASVLLVATGTLAAQGSIAWTAGFADALEKARKETKPVFVAINMDGERANDEMVRDVYKDTTLVELSKQTVNLFCSKEDHGGRCTRVTGLACSEHQKCEIAVRERILGKKEGEPVVAPQHLFLAPDGAVIASVAYRVTKAELEWMWVQAIKKVNPAATVQPSPRAKAPHELVVGDKPQAEQREAPPTKEQVENALKELKKTRRGGKGMGGGAGAGPGGGGPFELLRTIARSPDPDAIKFAEAALRGVPDKRKADMLEQIGRNSPKEWSELVASYVDFRDLDVRRAAVVALETLADPKSLAPLQAQLPKETDSYLKGRILRAMAAVAPANKAVGTELQKVAKGEKDELVRAQAFLAAAWLEDKAVASTLASLGLQDKAAKVRGAAACTIAVRRDPDLLPPLDVALRAEGDEKVKVLLEAAKQAVEKGAKLTAFQEFLKSDIGDQPAKGA